MTQADNHSAAAAATPGSGSASAVRAEDGRTPGVGGLRLSWTWHRVAKPHATVLIHPGFADHRGRYRFAVDALTAAGHDVFIFDPRGHGDSGGQRGHVDRFEDYDDDLRTMIAVVTERTGAPPVLVGQSQGGLIVCHAARVAPLVVRAIGLSNPALTAAIAVPGWKIMMAKGLSQLLPTVPVPVGIPPEAISRDRDVVEAYRRDPMVFSAGTTRWGAEFLRAQADVLSAPTDFGVPTLVLVGTGDLVVSAETTLGHFRPAPGLEVERYSGFYHELFNEPPAERAQPLQRLCAFVEAHAKGGG